jgi:hypothetical protein
MRKDKLKSKLQVRDYADQTEKKKKKESTQNQVPQHY